MAIFAPVLTATPASCSQVNLSWTQPVDAFGPELIPITTWPDASIEPYVVLIIPGKTYKYIDGANEAANQFGESLLPDGQTSYFIANTAGVLLFAWDAFQSVTASLRESNIKSYRVYRDNQLIIELPPHVTSYSETGLSGGTIAVYRVDAVDNAGTIARSDPVGTMTEACVAGFPFSFSHGNTSTRVAAVAADSSGNIYAVGFYPASNPVGFLIKITSVGQLAWAKFFPYLKSAGSQFRLTVTDVVIDSTGANVYICGTFNGSIDLGGGVLTPTTGFQNKVKDPETFIAKFNSSGVLQWGILRGNPAGTPDTTEPTIADRPQLAIDASNVLVLAGHLQNANFQAYAGIYPYVDRYDASGALVWSRVWVPASSVFFEDAAVNSSGQLLLACSAYTFNFGCGTITVAVDGGGGSQDGCAVKLDSAGNCVWSKMFGGPVGDAARWVTVDASDNIYVAGNVSFSGNFGGADRSGLAGNCPYIVKFDTNGNWIWDVEIRSLRGSMGPRKLAANANGVWLVGYPSGGTFYATLEGVDYQITTGWLLKWTTAGVEAGHRFLGLEVSAITFLPANQLAVAVRYSDHWNIERYDQ